jgi:hypothetical protein
MVEQQKNEMGNQTSGDKSKLDEMIELLPQPLRDTVAVLRTQDERMIGIYSAIAMAGSLMPNTYIHYDNKKCYPSLYVMIIKPPASGKGILNPLGMVLYKVNKELDEAYNTNLREYNQATALYKRSVAKGTPIPHPEKPDFSLLRLAGNITSSKFMEQLAENKGREFLIIIETEMDSFGITSRKGGFSDLNSTILRSAFEFESLNQMRRNDNERLSVDTPKLCVILSGTDSQVRNIFHSNADGLFSRFSFIVNNSEATWRSMQPNQKTVPLEDTYIKLSEEYYKLWQFQRARKIEVKLTNEQWEQINEFGSSRLDTTKMHFGENAQSLAKRHANMIARKAVILSVARAHEDQFINHTITCSSQDFKIALWLGEESFNHALNLYESLPGENSCPSDSKIKQFIDQLPDSFTVEQLKKGGKVKHITDRTLFRRLEQLRKDGFLENIKKGSYKKRQWQD